jgi:small subunit ribosomal protein S17
MSSEMGPGAHAERRRVRQQGTVASIAGDKSVVVQVERREKHPRYQKFISKRAKFMAHDERNECGAGDLVEIVSVRPLSARKRWRVSRIVRKAVVLGGQEA